MGFVSTLGAVLKFGPVAMQILGAVVGLVQAVEGLFGGGSGPTKKAAVMNSMQPILEAMGAAGIIKTAGTSTELQAALSGLIDAVVAIENLIEAFK